VATRDGDRSLACVYLVGAGPGDPDLLTVKALRVLKEADVVVFDRLVAPEILDLVPRGAARIYAGKAQGRHVLPQEEINDLLVRLARSHRRVVRLKGGDPYIFGRGSEEALHLAAHGIPFEVVPGVTAAAGCAAGIGVPLTHRGLATGVRFETGHCRGDEPLDLDWASMADPETTLVFYMALANLPQISRELVAAGLPADTPAAAISNGTTPQQQVCFAPLAELADRVRAAALPTPVIILVGRVVELAEKLGRRTRQAPPLAHAA
jgi:uroporphyrin-III C-methyltransferase/precorrin-2 dehydrogenase/sirohydrochlorin ferrochelatase/uroporphyrin-III C-methyltransferase